MERLNLYRHLLIMTSATRSTTTPQYFSQWLSTLRHLERSFVLLQSMILSTLVSCICVLLIHITYVTAASISEQFPAHGTTQRDGQQLLSDAGGPILRNATLADAWAIVDIVDAAFAPFASNKYRYQFRDKFPEEHRRCMYESYVEVGWLDYVYVQVIELPASSGETKPVSVAVWVDAWFASMTNFNLHGMSCLVSLLSFSRSL